jgi:SulP family sulfate permease
MINKPIQEVKHNLKPGLTVSLVSVPLSISLAIAGGGSPTMGIVTAFWAGLLSAIFGGSHYNITGPTGALSGVLAAAALKVLISKLVD